MTQETTPPDQPASRPVRPMRIPGVSRTLLTPETGPRPRAGIGFPRIVIDPSKTEGDD
ncbi:hypothetical protein [Sphingomonas sp.]|uniref:hypothetical protein n=1 Tax=Sphingomonas sp. TaxID=28214 RepID=UPI001B1F3D4C|nr:hypothetical protein [Sphingomonas sp.]MBO9713498.1 hypothetical protein [Sphingomonas sp.]